MKKFFLLALFLLIYGMSQAEPPKPPHGYRWVINEVFSDEFNGTVLDSDKWYDYHPWWKGRPPAKFVPEAISVQDGMLQIQNGVLDVPDGEYTIAGGAVVSKSNQAYHGYYESRFKASRVSMSTTFWFSTRSSAPLDETDCSGDRFSLELDVVECIGDAQTWPSFKEDMHANTHYWYTTCEGGKEDYAVGATIPLSSEVWEEFHTYGAWWKDENTCIYYADNGSPKTVQFRTEASSLPFSRPMGMNMVTETYDWEVVPSNEALNDDSRNTSYYDWTRSYELVRLSTFLGDTDYPALYTEGVTAMDLEASPLDSVKFEYTFKANETRDLYLIFSNPDGGILYADTITARRGYGSDAIKLKLDHEMELDEVYNVYVEMRPVDGEEGDTIGTATAEIVKTSLTEIVDLSLKPYYIEDTITTRLDYTTNEPRELVFTIKDSESAVQFEKKTEVIRGIVEREEVELVIGFSPVPGASYTLIADIRPIGGSESDAIVSDSFVMVGRASSINDKMEQEKLSIYPNPANNSITVSGVNSASTAHIYSHYGQLVTAIELKADASLDISEFSPGIYLLKLNGQTQRFIKK